ncbi:MAG: hypothetical protein WBP61_17470 [Nocardioides sp.]
MYGDTAIIRALAGRLGERAGEIRDLAATLLHAAERVPWTGLAADAMRAHVARRVVALEHCARLHEQAAEALERHAREVDRLTALLTGPLGTVVDGALDLLP